MNHQIKEIPYHMIGWILFLICSILFLYVAVRDNDAILALASLFFLCGCIAFLIPLLFPVLRWRGRRKAKRPIHR